MKNAENYYSFPLLKTKDTDTAFMSDAFPCNPIPFLNRMVEILRENGTDATLSYQFRANLLTVIMQTFGQLSTVDSCDLWQQLKQDYDIGMF